MSKVCVLGIWHLGSVTSACLAELGYQVIGVEKNAAQAAARNRGISPLFEPSLEEPMGKHLASGRLRFTADLTEGARDAPYIIIAYDTPVNEQDEPDLSPITATVKRWPGVWRTGQPSLSAARCRWARVKHWPALCAA